MQQLALGRPLGYRSFPAHVAAESLHVASFVFFVWEVASAAEALFSSCGTSWGSRWSGAAMREGPWKLLVRVKAIRLFSFGVLSVLSRIVGEDGPRV